MEIYIKIFVCGSVRFRSVLKNQSKIRSNPSGFHKISSKHINNIRFCAFLVLLDRFAVLIWISLDLNTPSSANSLFDLIFWINL